MRQINLPLVISLGAAALSVAFAIGGVKISNDIHRETKKSLEEMRISHIASYSPYTAPPKDVMEGTIAKSDRPIISDSGGEIDRNGLFCHPWDNTVGIICEKLEVGSYVPKYGVDCPWGDAPWREKHTSTHDLYEIMYKKETYACFKAPDARADLLSWLAMVFDNPENAR